MQTPDPKMEILAMYLMWGLMLMLLYFVLVR